MNSSDKDRQSRRRFLSTLLTAGLSLPSEWAKAKMDSVKGVPDEARRKVPVSPPGSIGAGHLHSLCTACGLCVSACPSKVLVPATKEYGPEGLMQPVMDFSKGWCSPECTACGSVCPTGAIEPLTPDRKENIKIGDAVVVRGLCLCAGDSQCDLCEKACPAGAIRMKEDYNAPIVMEDGTPGFRRYPSVEQILCTGCGACEHVCPSTPAKAVHVEGLEVHEN